VFIVILVPLFLFFF